jgi:hypothetical protein
MNYGFIKSEWIIRIAQTCSKLDINIQNIVHLSQRLGLLGRNGKLRANIQKDDYLKLHYVTN